MRNQLHLHTKPKDRVNFFLGSLDVLAMTHPPPILRISQGKKQGKKPDIVMIRFDAVPVLLGSKANTQPTMLLSA